MKPKEEWLMVPVPAIIEKEVFARVQDKLRANFLLSNRNTKNEYLVKGKIYCHCGRRRAGQGPMRGKYLYYRCIDSVLNFPLPRTCKEKSLDAKITDRLVWNGISSLMASPELLKSQIQRWANNQHAVADSSGLNSQFLMTEITKLKNQEERYNRAYGSGLFSLDQLKEYAIPVREKVSLYESQILKSEQDARNLGSTPLPDEKEIESFAKQASDAMANLSFEAKRGIVLNVVEKVVGTNKGNLQVYGFIPLTNVNVRPDDGHRRDIPRHGFDDGGPKRIPFRFEVNIPLLTVDHMQN
jgi:site-specific DNA recombinase